MAEVTGRDYYIIGYAIAHALVALEALPPERQPRAAMHDMRKLLSVAEPSVVAMVLSQARRLLGLAPTEAARP